MQIGAWADIKSTFGWKTEEVSLASIPDTPIFIYSRSVPSLGKFHYLPGITGISEDNAKQFTRELKRNLTSGFGARIEPYQIYDESVINALEKAGWQRIKRHVQYRDTILIDLSQKEEAILASFKSRARYEIKQATTFGVSVEEAELSTRNLEIMYGLLEETSKRNKFYIRDRKFTMKYWKRFAGEGRLKLFFARHEEDILAGAVIIVNKDYAWYKEGGSQVGKNNLLGPRLLLWEAMRALKKGGVKTFDLGGIPNPENHENSSMRGIYVFKSAFSRETVTLMPAMELALNSKYKLWPKTEEQWLRVYNLFARNLWY